MPTDTASILFLHPQNKMDSNQDFARHVTTLQLSLCGSWETLQFRTMQKATHRWSLGGHEGQSELIGTWTPLNVKRDATHVPRNDWGKIRIHGIGPGPVPLVLSAALSQLRPRLDAVERQCRPRLPFLWRPRVDVSVSISQALVDHK